jgi:DNA-binding response OmpR family regulator
MLVALTGWGQAQDRENATDAGFDRHLVKPYAGETLQGLIDEALRRDASGETSAS